MRSRAPSGPWVRNPWSGTGWLAERPPGSTIISKGTPLRSARKGRTSGSRERVGAGRGSGPDRRQLDRQVSSHHSPSQAESGPVWIETNRYEPVPLVTVTEGPASARRRSLDQDRADPETSQGHKAVFLSGDDVGTGNVIFLVGGADGSLSARTGVWQAGWMRWGRSSHGAASASCRGSSIPRVALAASYNAFIDTTSPGTCMCSAASAPQDLPCGRCGRPQSASTAASEAGRSDLPSGFQALYGGGGLPSLVFVVGGANSGNRRSRPSIARGCSQTGSWVLGSSGEPPGPLRLGTLLHSRRLIDGGRRRGTSLPGSA